MSADAPWISVIVPTRGRPSALAGCLNALAWQELPAGAFEVVVVRDGIDEPEPTVPAGWPAPIPLSVLRQAQAGPAAARNTGAARARGGWLAFTDDDCRPEPRWLAELLAQSRRHPGAAVGGRVVNALPDNPWAEASQMLLDHLYEQLNRDPGDARFFATCNLAVPADLFRDFGGFATGYPLAAGEDREFCRRWRAAGRRLVAAPAAEVRHAHPLTRSGFWLQQYHYGRGARRFHAGGRGEPSGEGFAPLAFYAGLLTRPMRAAPAGHRWRLAWRVALSQVAIGAGYLRESIGPGT
jgi:GT2 family glycosyltransferase